MKSGYRSERTVRPLADQILANLLADPSTPSYLLQDDSYGPALEAWSRAEAVVHLLSVYISEVGVPKALAGKGFLLETLRKWESTAAGHRSRIGLDPVSRVKIMRDFAAARYMTGPSLLDAALDDEVARLRALEVGNEES